MNTLPHFTLRQSLEALPLIFVPSACPDLEARIQFDFSGAEPGVYCLQIAQNHCTFLPGPCSQPTLSIFAPSDIWQGIMRGQVSGQEALTKGLYTMQGDPAPLVNWGKLFVHDSAMNLKAPPDQRPAGPLPLRGGVWMLVAFLPWIINWITFGSFGLSPVVSLGLPLLLSAAIVGYRLAYNRPGWLELGGLAFFTFGGLLTLLHVPAFTSWGSILSNLVLGMVWLASLFTAEPLSMQYIKWTFDRRLWGFSLFIFINAAISLVWGCQSTLAALLGAAGILNPSSSGFFTLLRYATLVPAYYFTSWYPKVGLQTPVRDTDRAQKILRIVAGMGLLVGLTLIVIIGQYFRS